MTRRFNELVDCPHCGKSHTKETAFERWMRDNTRLPSSEIVRFDLDVLVHRYSTLKDKRGGRDVQCLMFIEVKTHNAKILSSQQDTLSMLSQVLRNRRKNIKRDKRGRHAVRLPSSPGVVAVMRVAAAAFPPGPVHLTFAAAHGTSTGEQQPCAAVYWSRHDN